MINSAGRNRYSWRHNSEPIDPPAPVTRMRLPAKRWATAATSVRTGLRPSRSLIRGSRTPSMRALPLSSSVTEGTTFGVRPHRSASVVRSRIALPLARAIAMTRTVAPVFAATLAIWARSPRTGIPWICSRRLAGSSSRIATGRYTESGSWVSRRIRIEPASPAPKTMTSTASDAGLRDRWRTANSTYLPPSMAGTANITPPVTVSTAARCPVTSAADTSVTSRVIVLALIPTPMTSSRLPR